jgi:L-alanine-DL-glutamate epimerase-like enolase superfamily enzyme
MKLRFHKCRLQLAHKWKIANAKGSRTDEVIIVKLTDNDGITGLGEAPPSAVYRETPEAVIKFYKRVEEAQLSFDDVPRSMAYLETLTPMPSAARCGINTALMDGAAKRAGKPLYDFLKLGFREKRHVTSFSIGIDSPEIIRKKVLAAKNYPILKLKVGVAHDRENLAALRSVAPDKPVRVDANEAWKTKERALKNLEWLASDGHIQFVEQPMPRNAIDKDLKWLKERSPLPLIADESCQTMLDIPRCAEFFHGVNVKLVKAGGVSMAHETLQAARHAGLKTMIGCMIETSVLISAAAHLAELADYLDLDGNLLITKDPYAGMTAEKGILSFAKAKEKFGLRARKRA